MSDVVMPRLSASMEVGTILRWLRSDGDRLRAGDELVEIETDKATETYAIDREGVLEVVAAVGETLPVGALIARLDADGTPPAPAARAAAWGGTMIGAKRVTARVETVNVAPASSGDVSAPDRARSASAWRSAAICATGLASASKIVGNAVPMATPMFTRPCCSKRPSR